MFLLILYRIYQLVFMAPMIVLITIITGLFTTLGSWLGSPRFWGYWPPCIWSKLCCWLTLVRVQVRGQENISPNTSYVFVANHQGAYDIFAIYGFLGHNFRWMMKASLRKFPVIGISCAAAGMIFVDNSSPAAVRRTMLKAEKRLRQGMSLVVFPEGSRSFTGKVGAFHKGAYQLSFEFGLPVVPVTIDGSYQVLPRTSVIPHWGHIILTIHKPIAPPATVAQRHDVIEASRQAVISSLPDSLK